SGAWRSPAATAPPPPPPRGRPKRSADRATILSARTQRAHSRRRPMAVRVRTWIWIVVGIFALCVLGVIAMAGVGFYFFARHFDTHTATAASATRDFEEVKARLAGQAPLIELDDHGRY